MSSTDRWLPLAFESRDVRPGCSFGVLDAHQKALFPRDKAPLSPTCPARLSRSLFSFLVTVLTSLRGSAAMLIERPHASKRPCHGIEIQGPFIFQQDAASCREDEPFITDRAVIWLRFPEECPAPCEKGLGCMAWQRAPLGPCPQRCKQALGRPLAERTQAMGAGSSLPASRMLCRVPPRCSRPPFLGLSFHGHHNPTRDLPVPSHRCVLGWRSHPSA